MSDNDYLNPECAEAVRAALANSDACWRMEEAVIVRQRDEARVEVARLTAQLESITAENHERAQREARSLEDWASLRAEVEMLRGVGCREAKAGEPESGPCGVCLKCAEEQGARWALDSVGWSRADDRWSIARRICVKARNEHIGWIQCTQCGWGCEVHRFEVEAGDYVDRQACDSCGIGPCRIDWTYPDGPGWVAKKEHGQ